MSQEFDDIVNTLLSQIWDITDTGTRYLGELYLRSSCLKLLFAERRLSSLRSKVAYRKGRRKVIQREGYYEVTHPQNTLSIEMDFDHCILSLRSSLEHLAQLVNAIVPLNIPPKGKASESVSLKRVIDKIADNQQLKGIQYLNELSIYLEMMTKSNWYKELHKLRIESFHVKSGRLIETELMTLERSLIDHKFLLPSETVDSLKVEEDRDILNYCRNRIKDVQRTLKISCHTLSKYMSNRMD